MEDKLETLKNNFEQANAAKLSREEISARQHSDSRNKLEFFLDVERGEELGPFKTPEDREAYFTSKKALLRYCMEYYSQSPTRPAGLPEVNDPINCEWQGHLVNGTIVEISRTDRTPSHQLLHVEVEDATVIEFPFGEAKFPQQDELQQQTA